MNENKVSSLKFRGFFSYFREITSFLFFLSVLLLVSSCGTLSKEQIKSVEKFSNACDSFNRYPSLLFAEVARIRMERGLFYAASLSDPSNSIEELNSIYMAFEQDMKLASKCDISLKILKSYSNALEVLSSDERWKSRGVEFRSLGRAMDSLVIQTNKLHIFQEELPVGIANSAAKIVAYGAQALLKRKQHRLICTFVGESDTLVQALVFGLVQTLRSPQVAIMLENEKTGLPLDYKSFLRSSTVVPFNSIEYDRKYLQLKESCDKLTYSRGQIISAANRLAKAHKMVALSLHNKKRVGEVFEQLLQLIDSIEMVQKQFQVIIAAK